MISKPRIAWVSDLLLGLFGVGLLLSSIYRAATVPFTIDESLSFAIFTWDPSWGAKANNHLLNTTLMQWCSSLFGNSEISLRLPNVLAHGVYLLCTFGLVTRVRHPGLRVAGFMLFNLNLFLLDFFSLARGYGLALAAEALSLYLLVQSRPGEAQPGAERYVYLSAAAGALTVLSNFSFLNYYLPLLAAGAWILLSDPSLRRVNRNHVPRTLAFLSANGVFLALVLFKILKLRRAGQLYVGGQRGFVTETVQSLVRASLYAHKDVEAITQAISVIVVAVFFVLVLWGAYQLSVARQGAGVGILSSVLGAAVALPMLQHGLLRAVYPIERAALYYLPLYAAALLFALESWSGLSVRRWKEAVMIALSVAIAVPLAWHFARHFNADSFYTWWHDAHNTEVMRIVSQDHGRAFPGRVVKLRVSSILIPSFEFYRVTRHYTWLLPLKREPITRADAQYIYAFEDDLDTLHLGRDTRLASYGDIHTVLLRVEHADEP